MPVVTNFAYGEIRRMKGMPGYPGIWSEGEEQLVQALMDHADDERHATAMVSRLMRGWRNPALPESERAQRSRFTPDPIDVIDAATIPDVRPIELQPDEYKRSPFNPIEQIMGAGWFYEHITDAQIAKAEQWANHPKRADLRKFGQQILDGVRQRYATMSEAAWLAERERASETSARTVGHANQRGHCARCGDTGFQYTQAPISGQQGTVRICNCRSVQ